MSKYNEQLDTLVAQMKIAHEAIDVASSILGEHLDHLVEEIHRLEHGNIKEPLHVLHWHMGLQAIRSLYDAKTDLEKIRHVFLKNR